MRCSLHYLFYLLLFSSLFTQSWSNENSFEKKYHVVHIVAHAIDESEDDAYAYFIKKSIEKSNKKGMDLLILEINTLGGELSATLKIEELLRFSEIPSICFINNKAISAGSLIALSCDKLVMAPNSVIGAATPVIMSSSGSQKASEKVVSASRAIWRSASKGQERHSQIAEAFVDENVVLTKAKHGIDKPKGKLLTLTTKQAKKLGMINYVADDVSAILKREKIQNPVVHQEKPTFFYALLKFFLFPVVASICLTLGFLGLLYELKMPNWGITGSAGLLFISLYFIPRILVGFSNWGVPALIALGILFLLLEILVIPGFGIAGFLGLATIFFAVAWSYDFSLTAENLWTGLISLVCSVTLVILFLFLFFRKKNANNSLFLSQTLIAQRDKKNMKYEKLIGTEGHSVTVLRPSGMVCIQQQNWDALAQGVYIEKGVKIKVLSYQGSQLIVVPYL